MCHLHPSGFERFELPEVAFRIFKLLNINIAFEASRSCKNLDYPVLVEQRNVLVLVLVK